MGDEGVRRGTLRMSLKLSRAGMALFLLVVFLLSASGTAMADDEKPDFATEKLTGN